MSKNLSRRAAASFAPSSSPTLLAAGVSAAGAGTSAPPTAPDVPAPTGHRPFGIKTLHLVDAGRLDPWCPQPSAPRELMVSVRYPALSAKGPKEAYASEALSTALVGDGAFALIGTHAIADAPPAPGARPLIVLSPDFGESRVTLSATAEDLASHGYVVATVDHAHESAVEFPGGRIETCAARAAVDDDLIVRTRSADLRFVIDRLTGPGTGLFVDRTRIGVAGHSIGGASVVRAMRDDPRIDAAVDLGGGFLAAALGPELNRPVLLLGPRHGPGTEHGADWARARPGFTGWKRRLDVIGAGRLSFGDKPWIVDGFGLRERMPPEQAGPRYGTLDGIRATAITRAYVAAFFDRHLRGTPTRLFDGPTSAYPEVTLVE
ncbi:alpha/beta hydrolase family protein [Embleya scabrispora]|uniref:alpha/beta hydrolase family protein n=1 Tax=Embleya scabrispora TaxID=159449 RepID=UPI00036CBF11|nr:alpha/beta hydrolase [Embleya scabrispora]MYS85517.1 alpha/beta hydrolase [Streptomyces sp. SID5474]